MFTVTTQSTPNESTYCTNKNKISIISELAKKPVEYIFPRPLKILLIESESLTQKMHVHFLKSLSCEVVTLTSAQEMATKCKSDFDLIFVDPILSDINGLEICAAMRAKYHKYIRVIVLTHQKNITPQHCDWLTIDEIILKSASRMDFEEILKRFSSILFKRNLLN